MKRFLFFLLIVFFYNVTFSQFISSPKPLLYDGNGNDLSTNGSQDINGFPIFKATIGCNSSSVVVEARYPIIGDTNDYRVESIPYAPVRFGYNSNLPGQQITPFEDDRFFDVYDLGSFDFCFYNNSYNKFIMNDNGVVSFDLSRANQSVSGDPANGGWRLYYNAAEAAVAGKNAGDPIQLTATGNQFLLNNAIYLPGHDLITTNLPAGSEFYWNVYGTAPNRRLVIGLFEVPLFNTAICQLPKQNHQIILYETTNIIEVHIQNLDLCTGWNNGYSLIGIQNDAKDKGAFAPGRNTGQWDASYESWRFIPDGGVIQPTFTWYKNYDYTTNTGDFVSNNLTHSFNPSTTTTYVAEVRYVESCTGNTIIATTELNVVVLDNPISGEIDEQTPTTDPVETVTLCNGTPYTLHFTAISSLANTTIEYKWYKDPNTDLSVPANVLSTTDSFTIPDTTGNNTYGVLVTLYDANGVELCNISDTVKVNFVVTEDASFSYSPTSFCASTDTNPAPINVVTLGGTFSINNGGVIDASTGVIDLTASGTGTDGTGNFTITYTTPSASCGSSSTFDVSIGIGTPALDYDAAYCSTGANPAPNSFSPAGGTFTIDNGATFVDNTTGEIDISSLTVGTTYTVTYTTTGV